MAEHEAIGRCSVTYFWTCSGDPVSIRNTVRGRSPFEPWKESLPCRRIAIRSHRASISVASWLQRNNVTFSPVARSRRNSQISRFPWNVEFFGWFVEEQNLRVAREDPAEFQPLPHSGGEPSDRPVCVCGEVQTTEPFLQFRFGISVRTALKPREEAKVLD